MTEGRAAESAAAHRKQLAPSAGGRRQPVWVLEGGGGGRGVRLVQG